MVLLNVALSETFLVLFQFPQWIEHSQNFEMVLNICTISGPPLEEKVSVILATYDSEHYTDLCMLAVKP